MKVLIFLSLVCLASAGRQKIVGGVEVTIEDYPWSLSLGSTSTSHNCGAILITAQKALTAAHCVSDGSTYYLTAGSTDRTAAYTTTTTSVTRHPDFENNGAVGYPNDVATMYLAIPLEESESIQYASLATEDDGDFAGADCSLSGWGRLSGGGILPTILNAAPTNAISNTECVTMENGWSEAQINPGHICFFTGQTGACNGDSGGPAQCYRDGEETWTVVGITSWGASGCLVTRPSVYTRISYFLDWIADN